MAEMTMPLTGLICMAQVLKNMGSAFLHFLLQSQFIFFLNSKLMSLKF